MGKTPKAALALALLAVTALGATPGSVGAAAEFRITTPQRGDVLYGNVLIEVEATPMPGFSVQGVAFFGEGAGLLGTDVDGMEPARGGWGCFARACFVPNTYSTRWNIPASQKEGPFTLSAVAQVCELRGECFQVGSDVEVYVEPTPPIPVITSPAYRSKQPPAVLLSAVVPDDNVVRVNWAVGPIAFAAARGVPLKDQHVDGADISNDVTDQAGTGGPDGRPGDFSCGPTAAASSLAWFAATGTGGIMPNPDFDGGADPTETANEELTEQIGRLSGIDPAGGVSDPGLEGGIRGYLGGRGLGGQFDVGRRGGPRQPGIPGADIDREFQRGQDVLIGFTPNGGGTGHWMTVNNVTQNADGSHTINVMDPWTGQYADINVDANGRTNYDGGGVIDGMIHVSPKNQNLRAVPSLDRLPTGTWNGLFADPLAPMGWYIAQATATDATGLTFSTVEIFFFDP